MMGSILSCVCSFLSWCLSKIRECWYFLQRKWHGIHQNEEKQRLCAAKKQEEVDIPILLLGSSEATEQFAAALKSYLQNNLKELNFPSWNKEIYRSSDGNNCVLAICGVATRVLVDLEVLDDYQCLNDNLRNMVLILLHCRRKEEIYLEGYINQSDVKKKYPSIGHIYEFDYDIDSGEYGIYQSQVNDQSMKELQEVLRQKMPQRQTIVNVLCCL